MKEMKKILSFLLVLAMVIGFVPATAFAVTVEADFTGGTAAATDYLFFATDRHTNTTIIGNIINNMESAIGENKLEYLGLGGDMVGSGESHPAYNSSTVLKEVTGATSSLNATNVDIVAGIHDMNVTDDAGIVLPYQGGSGFLYEGDHYYVYGVEEYCISEDSNSSNWSAEAQKFVDWANGEKIDKNKVVIVLSHYPLHAKRNDNDGAYYWHQALNTVATGSATGTAVVRDVVFFHGHNHTKDSNEYVYGVGDTMSIQNGSSTTSGTIYYTYATAGYLNQNSKATLVTITDTTLTLTKYGTSGSGTAMASVERKVASTATPTSLVVKGANEYTVGDTYVAPTVSVEYDDNTTKTLTADEYTVKYTLNGAEVSGVDTSVAGEYTLTYKCTINGYAATATFTVTVKEAATEAPTTEATTEATEAPTTEDTLLSIGAEGTGVYTVGDVLTIGRVYASYQKANKSTYSADLAADQYTYEVRDINGVAVTGDYMNTVGEYQAYITYKDKHYSYWFTVNAADELNSDTGVTVKITRVIATAITVADKTEAVADVMANVADAYVAYDITLTEDVGMNAGNYATVSIPVDSNWDTDNLTVYHVEDGALSDETFEVTYANGYVTFRVSHFSTYVVTAGAVTGGTGTVPGDSTTTTKDVWKLTSSLNNNGTYLIVNTNAAESGYALLNNNGTVSAVEVTVVNDGTNTYIELDNANAVWTATGSETSWAFANNSKYLGYTTTTTTGGGSWFLDPAYTNYTYTLGMVESSTSWTLGSNQLYAANLNTKIYDSNNMADYNETNNYYISGGSSWTMDTESANVYFYAPGTITTTEGTQTATYGINITVDGTAASTMNANNVVNGDTLTLGTAFTTTVTGQNPPSTGTYTWTSSDTTVATVDNTGKVTFTGVAGVTTIRAEYTWTVNGTSYTVYNTLVITTTAMSYSMNIVEETATVKIGASQTLTVNYLNGDGNAVTPENVTWISDKEAVATVENGVVKGVAAGSATITAKWTDPAGVEHTDSVTVEVVDAVYTLDLWIHDGTKPVEEITAPVAIKGMEAGDTYSVWAVIKADGVDIGSLEDPNLIEWISSDTSVATVDPATGVITFTGKEGTVNITATYKVGNKPSDTITISVTKSNYTVPADGTDDFTEYPNEGAIRFDKTATAVGNFSETGIVQIELSMTGVPYTTGAEIDVVVMLDMTGSMSDDGMEAAELATIAFMEKIVKKEDGTYNGNRIAVYAFNSGSSSPYELVSLKKITSDDELATATTAIKTASNKQTSGGTPFDEAAQKCHDVLAAAKTDGTGNDRQQFCVFMSDGGPTTYKGSDGYTYYGGNASGDRKITSYIGGYSSSTSSSWTYSLPTEYWTDDMKADGVTVYTVGLLLQNAPSNPSPYSSMTDSTMNSDNTAITTVGSHYYFTSKILKGMATDESKYIDIFDVDNASQATAAFEAIALSILQAATDVTVEDKITDEYTMIFDIPTDTKYKHEISTNQEFYIEFVKYTLDANHERTGTGTSVTKLYLIDSNGDTAGGTYSAGSSATVAYAVPVFENKIIGEKGTLYYWTTDSSYASKAAVSYSDGTNTYYFYPYGIKATDDGYDSTKWFNMTSGAYANGNINAVDNVSYDLVIATPYFVYNAATKKLYWTVDKIDTTEYALRYFLYLNDSATDVGESTEAEAKSYLTNEYAYLTYTNFKGNDCRQEFPKPQMTWNGAQVSYVFYLVNAQGQPINKSGQIVDFANATFITEVFTKSVVWNKEGDTTTGTGNLSADWEADALLPDDYLVYDAKAGYVLNVYENADGSTIKNQFTIEGDTAVNISARLNKKLANAGTTATTVSLTTTKVYNTKAGTKITGYGTYTSDTLASIDFSNTTVAFAVVWQPALASDTVVVDFGLDVLINVTANDLMQEIEISGIGIGRDAYGEIAMNSGVSTSSKLGTANLTIDGNTISIESKNQVRFSQGDMIFTAPVTFYYEAKVNYFENSEKNTGYMHSSVTVIPATTVYYEDSFLSFDSYTNNEKDEKSKWTSDGTTINGVQAEDRPGTTDIVGVIDANNNYGYDAAYENMSTYSMGSAAKITVDANTRGEATFTFYGTGFDIIGLTSNATGTLIVQVTTNQKVTIDGATYEAGSIVKTTVVDTYYGMDADGNVSTNDPNAIWQVPVIKIFDLPYGQYTAKLVAGWNDYFDHTDTKNTDGSKDGYDLYLDAVRIYDPTGNQDDVANDAYKDDGEGWPVYAEVRDLVIKAETFNKGLTDVSGVVFIDCMDETNVIADYKDYGPNNELYLANGQAIAFKLELDSNIADVQIGMKAANGKYANYEIYNATTGETIMSGDLNTTTDMYYSIGAKVKNGDVIVIKNNENTTGSILSLTNIKVTHLSGTNGASVADVVHVDDKSATNAVNAMALIKPVLPSFSPETMDVRFNRTTAAIGNNVVITVTTSNDVDDLLINGQVATNKTTSYVTGETVWSFTVPVVENGSLDVRIVGFDANGTFTIPYTESVAVINMSGNQEDLLGKIFG